MLWQICTWLKKTLSCDLRALWSFYHDSMLFLNCLGMDCFFKKLNYLNISGAKKNDGLSPWGLMSFIYIYIYFIKVKLLNYSWVQN